MTRWIFLPLLALIATPTNQPEPKYFRYQRTVTLTDRTATGQTCTPVPAHLFAKAAWRLADLRLYQGSREVPYVIPSMINTDAAPRMQPIIRNLGVSDSAVVFDAQMTEPPTADSPTANAQAVRPSYSTIEILTSATRFLASVEVLGSETPDMQSPTRLGTFTIFDLTHQRLTRSTVIHLPPSTFRYLHFVVKGPLKPADITGVTILDVPATPPVYRVIAESRAATQQPGHTIIDFRIPRHVPVDRVEIIPPSGIANFSRNVVVQAFVHRPNDGPQFSGTIFRIDTEQSGLRVNESRYTVDIDQPFPLTDTGDVRWRVTIMNRDDAPLPLQSVRLLMRERQLCFDATAGASAVATYTAMYGDTTLQAPRYDYATVFRPQPSPAAATWGPEQANPLYQSRPDTRPFTERHVWLLRVALILVIVLLGVVAVRTAGRMRAGEGAE